MNILKRSLIISIALLQPILFVPRVTLAEDPIEMPVPAAEPVTPEAPVPETQPPAVVTPVTEPAPVLDPQPAIQGPTTPSGPERSSYVYNEATGLWENDYYTWDPITKKTAPKGSTPYSYNPETGRWDTVKYYYDVPSGSYQPNIVSATIPPAGAAIEPFNESTDLYASSLETPGYTGNTNTQSGTFDLFYNAQISNNIVSGAYSGDSMVTGNTQGGSAVSGNALAMATVLNLLQSVWSPMNGDIETFRVDIDGDVTGDLTIDPGQIPQNLSVDDNSYFSDLEVNVSQDTALHNTLNLAAGSGQSKVASNTSGGDATTGTATAIANVVNMLNSMISSGQSFVGTVNINGNLNGDILMPEDMINQLLASNVPRATLTTDQITNSSLLADFTDNTDIRNNVTTAVASGDAEVSGNTTGGDATTGNASTNITILNLTGREIVGSNAMLVFVNVLGSWVGMIIDAPGATSAALGGGITENNSVDLSGIISAETDADIMNDINLAAHSGDASVTHNTRGGNATTGAAQAGANIANVSNSAVSVGDWFGILFINVLGNWFGSFGVDTEAGNTPTTATASPAGTAPDMQAFRFNGASNGSAKLVPVTVYGTLGTARADEIETAPAVLASSDSTPPFASVVEPFIEKSAGIGQLFKLFGISSLLFLGGEGLLSARKRHISHAKFHPPLNSGGGTT